MKRALRCLAGIALALQLLACGGGDGDPTGMRGSGVHEMPSRAGTGGDGQAGAADFGNGGPLAGSPAMPPVMQRPPTPGAAGGQLEPVNIDQCLPTNPAGLGEADVQKLMAGSGDAGGMRFLYPYDGTV